MVEFSCQCGAKLKAPDDKAGQPFRCPKCGYRGTAPHNVDRKGAEPSPPPLPPGWNEKRSAPSKALWLACPSCGSDQAQRVSVLYSAGTSQTQAEYAAEPWELKRPASSRWLSTRLQRNSANASGPRARSSKKTRRRREALSVGDDRWSDSSTASPDRQRRLGQPSPGPCLA